MNVLKLSGSVTKAVGLGIGDSKKSRLKPARTADPIVKEPPSEAHRSDPLTPVSHKVCTSVKRDYFPILIGREGFALHQRAGKGAPQRPAIHRMEEEERQERDIQGGMEEQTGGNPWGYQGR